MKLKSMSVIIFSGFFAMAAQANEVLLTANQPMTITYKVAHKNQNNQPVFSGLQTINVNDNVRVPISLDNYDKAGIVIVSANGHELPPSINQFDQAKQCSMTTNKSHATGALEFTLSQHSISCSTYGGVFG